MKKHTIEDFFEKLKISNLLISDPIYGHQIIISEKEAEEILDIGILKFFLNRHGIKQCDWEEYFNYDGDYLEYFRYNKKNKNGSNCKFH